MRETVNRALSARDAIAIVVAFAALMLGTTGCPADVGDLEAETKELRAELRDVRDEMRAIRAENRELREAVDGLTKSGATGATSDVPAEVEADAGAVAGGGTDTAAPPRQANVKIGIESNPRGATVFLEDKVLGRTPLLYEHKPGSEQLLLRIEKPGYRPRLLSIRPDEDAKISVQLAKQ